MTTTATKLTYEERCFQWASSFYLFETLNDDYFELSEDKQHQVLESLAWEPFQFHEGYQLAGYIDDLADNIIQGTIPTK
tara:strand:+ start:584 stop:820 length:237 start_codon:yes stop_codon:yes gene_type:complete